MKSRNGFVWPTSGIVKCPDWNPHSNCGNGLHGYLPNKVDLSVSNTKREDPHRKFLVVKVKKTDIVDLQDKVKFKEGEVIYCGSLYGALNLFENKLFVSTGLTNGDLVYNYSDSVCGKSYGHSISYSKAISIKNNSFAECLGEYGLAACLGQDGRVKGDRFCKLILVNSYGIPYTATVGKNGIKKNTWYKLSRNKFLEIKY